jgi:hypothetical protein
VQDACTTDIVCLPKHGKVDVVVNMRTLESCNALRASVKQQHVRRLMLVSGRAIFGGAPWHGIDLPKRALEGGT